MTTIVVLWIHVTAVIIWIGGMVFQWTVLRPILLGSDAPSYGMALDRRVRFRFRNIRWLSLIILVVTGVMNLLYEGGSARLESDWGGILMIKIFLVVIIIGLNVVYDVVTGPQDGKNSKSGHWLLQGIVLLSLLTVFISVYLSRF